MKTTILCLGGIPKERVPEAIKQFRLNPEAQLIFTGVGDHQLQFVKDQCAAAKAPSKQLIIDGKGPGDTVTEFTMTLDWIRKFGSNMVLIVTSDWHMPRAVAIAKAAYLLSPIGYRRCPSSEPNPGRQKQDSQWIEYDRNRTLIWRLTGYLSYDRDLRRTRQPWWDGK